MSQLRDIISITGVTTVTAACATAAVLFTIAARAGG
jgi:hypothetical protein